MQEDVYTVAKCFPVLGWKAYNSAFEDFVCHILLNYGESIDNHEIDDLFAKLRKKHGDIAIIDYYEVIMRMA